MALPPDVIEEYYNNTSKCTINWTLVKIVNNEKTNDCIQDIELVLKNETGIIDTKKDTQIKVFPNPTYSKLYLSEYSTVYLYNVSGSLLYQNAYCNQIDISNFISGTYILKTVTDGIENNLQIIKK